MLTQLFIDSDKMNEDKLMDELLNPGEGMPCAMCQLSEGKECITNKLSIRPALWIAGMDAEEEAEDQGDSDVFAAKKARFACYRAYVFTVSNWHKGMGCIRVPTCVVDAIRRKFPGDGVYIGHKKRKAGKELYEYSGNE